MIDHARPLEIAGQAARRLRPVALLIAVIISCGYPIGYYFAERRSDQHRLDEHAVRLASQLEQLYATGAVMPTDPAEHWRVLQQYLQGTPSLAGEIRDPAGNSLARYTRAADTAEPRWPGLTLTAAAPLRLHERHIGTVALTAAQTDVLRAAGLVFLFTASVGCALGLLVYRVPIAIVRRLEIAKTQCYETATRRHAEIESLLRITNSLLSGLNLQQILERIALEAARLAATPHVKLLLIDGRTNLLHVAVLRGRTRADGFPLPVGTGLSGQVAQTGEPLYVADTHTDPRSVLAAQDRALGIHTYLGLPIRTQSRVLGVLTFNDAASREYTPEEMAHLTSFADQAAIAIECARLYTDAEARANDFQTLDAIGRAVTSQLHLSGVLAEVVHAAMQLLGNPFAQIVLWDEATRQLTFGAAEGPTSERVRTQQFQLGRGINGRVAETREPMIVDDYHESPYAVPECADVVATITVPILFGDRLLGVLHSHTTEPGRRFTAGHLRRLQTLATHAAIAIENARLFAELQRSYETLRQSQKMEAIGQLAGGVAHDFNNLLTVITGYSEMLLARLPRHDPARGKIEEILQAGERASALTQQLLAFSRKQVLQPQILDLNAHVAKLQEMLRRLIGEDIALETRLAQPLGCVKADPVQIQQVIINLAVNARDAMPQGGRLVLETANVTLDEAAARAAGLAAGAYVRLAVTDTGRGMSPEVMEHIFEPFFTTKGDGKGTGLGLSTVYGIVSQSGGHVRVESELGRGTTMTIYLPAVSAAAEGPPEALAAPVRRGGGERVLVVEDEEAVRHLTAAMLQELGYAVAEAGSADEALSVLRSNRQGAIRLMLTDVVMPGTNGLELRRIVAAEHPAVRVILMSGYTDHSLLTHGALDASPFLQKPFSSAGLLAKVRTVLEGQTVAPV